ncbi:MAG: hypothetical protein KGL39_45855, partial [Patescibacteria group bacterium]|nr:hypothetical protein [Patescibacteria group bacterium]
VMPTDTRETNHDRSKPVASAAAVPETAAAEVVKRLRADAEEMSKGYESCPEWDAQTAKLEIEAADLISRQAAQIERLLAERYGLRAALHRIIDEYDMRYRQLPNHKGLERIMADVASKALAATATPSDSSRPSDPAVPTSS